MVGPIKIAFTAFDTNAQILTYDDQALAYNALEQVKLMCQDFEQTFSRTIPNTDVSRINSADTNPTCISKNTADLIEATRAYSLATRKTFDITVGSLTQLWDFKAGIIPKADAIQNALQFVGIDHIKTFCNNDNYYCTKDYAQIKIDLGGIAKGWIADKIRIFMKESGLSCGLIDLGGNIATFGKKPDGSLWKIGIKNPKDPSTILAIIKLDEASTVTSGIYERAFKANKTTYHHILDPATGYPAVIDYPSVSIVAKNSIDAEGFSTGFLILGPERAKPIADAHDEITQVFFIDRNNQIITLK
jgi:thiamine biosynthesis lipoprotein